VVLPAYNAGKTLRRTVAEIDRSVADDVVLVDDASRDDTVQVARELGLHLSVHARNRGYGGNQKTCYAEALKRGAACSRFRQPISSRPGTSRPIVLICSFVIPSASRPATSSL
jgi:glycosyltransferase involved in cell wall biosynthesis